jgi:CRP/FNR family transcriptional activator FtrB
MILKTNGHKDGVFMGEKDRQENTGGIPSSQGLPIKNVAGDITPGAFQPLAEFILHPNFVGSDMTDLVALLRDSWVQHFSSGHILFHDCDPALFFYIILDGHVELFVERDGKRSVLEVAACSGMIGEAALYGTARYMETARIVGHSRLLVVPALSFLLALRGRFDLTLRMLAVMSTRLHGMVKQISSLKLKSTAQRLAGFLLGFVDTDENATIVRFPYDKRLAAESLGMSAETLSRALTRLAPIGVRSHSDNAVVIDDVAALRAFCGEDGET